MTLPLDPDRIAALVAAQGWILRKCSDEELTFEDVDGGTFTFNAPAWQAVRKVLINS